MSDLSDKEKKKLTKLKRLQPSLFRRLLNGAVMALAVQGTRQGIARGNEKVYNETEYFPGSHFQPDYSGQANDVYESTPAPLPIGMGGKRRKTKKGKRKNKKRTMKRKKKNSKRRGKKKTSKRR